MTDETRRREPRDVAPRATTAAPPERRQTEIDKQRVPMAAKPYRLLALVKQDAVVRVQKEPDDTVMVWPQLLAIEFFAAAMISVFLILMGLFANAPLEELANANVTPASAKAPWYLLGLQELLTYFHPVVAGVIVPFLAILGALFLIPYVDISPGRRPSERKTAVVLFSIWAVAGLVVTFFAVFFRGAGYSASLFWVSGLHFSL